MSGSNSSAPTLRPVTPRTAPVLAPSPRRHSFAPSSSTCSTSTPFEHRANLGKSAGFGRSAIFGGDDDQYGAKRRSLVDGSQQPAESRSFHLDPAPPPRLSVTRNRSTSYSSTRPNSYFANGSVPNFSMPNRPGSVSPVSPVQWASTSRTSLNKRQSFLDIEASDASPDAEIESPMDTYMKPRGVFASAQAGSGVTRDILSPQGDSEEVLETADHSVPDGGSALLPPALSPLPNGAILGDTVHSTPRRLSPVAVAAVADTPPRVFGPPSVPPKSTRRSASRTASQTSLSAEASWNTRDSDVLAPERRLDRLSCPPSADQVHQLSPTAIIGLTQPRPRIPRTSRTPSLSQTGSASSRASSSVFTPSSSANARSLSGLSADDGTDWTRTSISESVQSKEEADTRRFSSVRLEPPLPEHPHGLGLDPVERIAFEGFGGGGLEDDDLQRGLEELARYAQSLPSPIPNTYADWTRPTFLDDDRTLVLTSMPVTEEPPISHSRSFSRPASRSRSRSNDRGLSQSRRPSAARLDDASSQAGLPDKAARKNSMSHNASRSSSIRRQRHASNSFGKHDPSESDAYLSIDDTDDESVGFHPYLNVHSHRHPNDLGHLETSPFESHAVGWSDEEVLTSEGPSRRVVADFGGISLENASIRHDTTHLILAGSTTPHLTGPFLRRVIPTLSTGLNVLDLSFCGLVEVPDVIAGCRTLRELDLKGNLLASGRLPSLLSALTNLRVLIADSCGLKSLPHSLHSLRHLHTLSLRYNLLQSLPSWMARLDQLEVLLVDGNEFHWQWSNLLRPLLLRPDVDSLTYSLSPRLSQGESTLESARSSLYLSTGSAGMQSPLEPSRSPSPRPDQEPRRAGSHPNPLPAPDLTASLPASASSSAIYNHAALSMSTPPPSSKPHLDIAEAQALARQRHHSDQPSAQPDSTSNKWNKMLKKVSLRTTKPKERPGALADNGRSFSQPITTDEATSAEANATGLFRSRVMSRPGKPAAVHASTSSLDTERAAKRRSYLKLDAVPSLKSLMGQIPSPVDQKAALRAVMAYLRDLDDLTSRRVISDIAPPKLRTSPSAGSLAPSASGTASVRRAQSTRRLPIPSRSQAESTFGPDENGQSADMSESLNGVARKLRDDPARRSAVVKEIVETEKTYVKGLNELVHIYVAPASALVSSASGKKDSVIPAVERRVVFGNIDPIRDFHAKIFLPDLITAADSFPDDLQRRAEQVAAVFIRHVAFLKIYSSYVNAFDAALTRLQTWSSSSTSATSSPVLDGTAAVVSTLSTSQRKRVKHFLKRARANPSHSQISLDSYLLLPVQRIPRYRMLLDALATCTPVKETDEELQPNPVIEKALSLIADVATDMNERKRESEGRSQLLQWQTRIGLLYRSPLVQPHRLLIKSGPFTLVRTVKRQIVGADDRQGGVESLHTEDFSLRLIALLCTDIIVFVKEPADPGDQTGPVELYTVTRLSPNLPGRPPPVTLFGAEDMLRITCDSRAVLYVQCPQRSEAVSWQNAINLQASLNS